MLSAPRKRPKPSRHPAVVQELVLERGSDMQDHESIGNLHQQLMLGGAAVA